MEWTSKREERELTIAVLSDTHIPIKARELPDSLLERLNSADLIVHCGDFVELEVLEQLNGIKETIAVQGNMDYPEVRKVLPVKRCLEVDGFKIGIIHGSGGAAGLMGRVRKEFDDVDCIIFGHSHSPCNEIVSETLLFNPGSPTDTVFAPYRSFGMLRLGDKIEGELIRL